MRTVIQILLSVQVVYALGSKDYRNYLYGSNCWPSTSVWNFLNDTMEGRLTMLIQPAYFCHDPHFDAKACEDMYKNSMDMQWTTDQSGALVDLKWLADPSTPFKLTCTFNVSRSLPCP